MADGRCFTVNTSAQLLNNYVMKKNGITFEDNYSYRQLLQKQGPELMSQIQDEQGTNKCNSCDIPLVNASDIY
jgi:hypothetical protein